MSVTSPLSHGIVVNSTINGKFKYDPSTTTGLTFGYDGATYQLDGNAVTVAAGTIALIDNETNIVELSVAGAVEVIASGSESKTPLYKVVTSGGAITSITDLRSTYQQ